MLQRGQPGVVPHLPGAAPAGRGRRLRLPQQDAGAQYPSAAPPRGRHPPHRGPASRRGGGGAEGVGGGGGPELTWGPTGGPALPSSRGYSSSAALSSAAHSGTGSAANLRAERREASAAPAAPRDRPGSPAATPGTPPLPRGPGGACEQQAEQQRERPQPRQQQRARPRAQRRSRHASASSAWQPRRFRPIGAARLALCASHWPKEGGRLQGLPWAARAAARRGSAGVAVGVRVGRPRSAARGTPERSWPPARGACTHGRRRAGAREFIGRSPVASRAAACMQRLTKRCSIRTLFPLLLP